MDGKIIRNKKVYILYPPISKMERYSSKLGSVGGQQVPLGIFYLAAFIREKGYEVEVCDAEAEGLEARDIIDRIRVFGPDVVGISSTTVAFHRALEIAEDIKDEFPDVVTVLGGPHITSNAEHAMAFDAFDYGVIGEGEVTFHELLEALSEGTKCSDVNGLAYRVNGSVHRTAAREYIRNLDEIPMPAYDMIKDIGLYAPPPSNYRTLPVLNIITSRGCPNLCTFCDRNVFGRRYRERSAREVFNEIKYLHDTFHIREIAFVDDTFLINKKRVRELFDMIKAEGLRFDWTCMARINNVDFEFLEFLRDNGCWNIAFGIESGDEDVLKVIKKNISLERTEEVIDWCDRLGIETKGFFIIGHPTETLESIEKTIAFACRLKLTAIVVTINTPIPGSQQYAEAGEYGTLDTADWSKFNYWRPVFVPRGLSEEILLKKQEEFYMRFYFRRHILWRYVKSFFGRGGLKRFKSVAGLFVGKESMAKVGRFVLGRK